MVWKFNFIQKNSGSMKKIVLFYIFICATHFIFAQQFDVFHNKIYHTNFHVFKDSIEADHIPVNMEVYQDINSATEDNWSHLEMSFRTQILGIVHDVPKFLKLQSRIKNIIELQNEMLYNDREYGYDETNYKGSPTIEDIKIQLISIVNERGVYEVNYNFKSYGTRHRDYDIFTWKDYYILDFSKKKISAATSQFSEIQLNKIKQSVLPKIYRLYQLNKNETEASNLEIENHLIKIPDSFSKAIDFSEAQIFPFFSGLMLTFSNQSTAYKLFAGKPFRVYLQHQEIKDFVSAFPNYQVILNTKTITPNQAIIQQLNNDSLFDLSFIRTGPTGLQAIDLVHRQHSFYTVKVEKYIFEKSEPHTTELYTFNNKQQLIQVEHRDNSKKAIYEKSIFYNPDGQISLVKTKANDGLEINNFHYNDGILNFVDHIKVHEENYRLSEGENVRQEQALYCYNNNYRHYLRYNSVGALYPHGIDYVSHYRSVSPQEYCTEYACTLLDSLQKFKGIRVKQYTTIDLAFNTDGQILETYLDNDRDQYFFTYNTDGRIQKFEHYSSDKRTQSMEYQYHEDCEHPLTIINDQASSRYEYYFYL